jgi:hypothetical protein
MFRSGTKRRKVKSRGEKSWGWRRKEMSTVSTAALGWFTTRRNTF